jgi:hypothetical protein
MHSGDLTPDQCRKLAEIYGEMQGKLGRILKRMEKRRFPNNDQLHGKTQYAFDVMQDLRMHAHYLGCRGDGGPELWMNVPPPSDDTCEDEESSSSPAQSSSGMSPPPLSRCYPTQRS